MQSIQSTPAMHLRLATRDDVPALTALIEAAIRGIGAQHYTPQQIESSLQYLFGKRLLDVCEAAAAREGYQRYELVATLTGLPLYGRMGYREVEPIQIRLPDGTSVEAVKMEKP